MNEKNTIVSRHIPFRDTVLPQPKPETDLNPYILYEDGLRDQIALLGFARRITDMKRPAYHALQGFDCCADYLTLRVNRIKALWPYTAVYMDEETGMLLKNLPFVVDDLEKVTCDWCGTWGELNRYGMCEMCYLKIQRRL